MSIRAKKKRRLVFLAAALVLFVGLAAGAYAVRSRQIKTRLAQSRAEGAAALAAGDYETALHKVGTYLQRNPDDVDAIYQYAQAREQVPLADNKHVGQAIAHYRRLLVLRPLHEQARRRLLQLYVTHGFTQEALDLAGKLGGDDPDALRAKAIGYFRMRDYPKALQASQRYNELAPDDLDVQRLTMDVMLAQGTPATEVVARAQGLEAKHPGAARFELLTGVAYRAAGDNAAARASLRKAAAHESESDPVFVRTLVEQLESLELFEESLGVLRRAAAPDAAENRRLFVGRLFQAERYQEVADRLEDLKSAGPKADAELLALRALALFNLKRYDEVPPVVAALEGRFDSGAEAWGPVLEAVARTPPAAPAKVIAACTAALRRAPASPYFHHFLAAAYSAVGEQDHAVLHWVQATRLAPAWAAPRARVAMLFVAAGRPADALRIAADARDRASNDPGTLQAYGEALAAVLAAPGRRDAGLAAELDATASKIAALDPDNDSAVAFKVLAQAADGKKDQAAASVRAALDGPRLMPVGGYIRLASISKAFELGLEDACLQRCEKARGRVGPALAAYRARALLAAGKPAEARRLLEAAGAGNQDPADAQAWRTAWAAYLDVTSDPAAHDAWAALANDFPADAVIQSMAVRAACLQNDREFLDKTIDRLRDATGPDAVGWRMARARFIAAGATGPDRPAQLAKAATLLAELTRDLPDLPEPRILLAKCMQALGNSDEAARQLRRVVEAAPQLHTVGLDLAGLLQSQGDYAGAKAQAERVAQNPSASPQDRAAAAALLARGGDAGQARQVLEQVLKKVAPGGAALPQQALLLADLYRRQGELTRAKEVCEQVLAAGRDPAAVAMLADVLAALGQTDRAEQELATLDGMKLAAPQKELIRGNYYAARGDRARAGEQFAAATRAAPGSAAAWRALARHQLASGDLKAAVATAAAAKGSVQDEGLAALQRVAAVLPERQAGAAVPLASAVLDAPGDADAVVDVLKCLAQAGQNPSRRALAEKVRQVARRYPRVLIAQTLAARVTLAAGGSQDAVQALAIANDALQNFPTAAEPAEVAASALAALGRWDEAAAVAQQWKQRDPASAGADIALATAHLSRRQPNPQAAIDALKRYVAAAADPAKSSQPLVVQATILSAQAQVLAKHTDEAEKLLAGRIGSPQYRSAWLALAGRLLPDHAAAERWLTAAAQQAVNPTLSDDAALAEAWLSLARRSNNPFHRARAADLVKALGSRAEGSAEAKAEELVAAGILCEDAGDRAAAERLYNRALQKDASHPVALNNLAMILADRNDAAAAEPYAVRAAATEHPRQANFYDTLATVQEKSRRWDKAGASIEQAVAMDPDNVSFQIHRAVILAAGGDAVRARRAMDAVEGLGLEDPRLSQADKDRLKSLRQRAAAGSD